MFAPDHAATAAELAGVVAPGGRIALANCTPEGGVGQMFKMMGPFLAPPVPGAGNPFEWGREEVVRKLLGHAFELDIEEHLSTLNVPTGEDYWQLFSSSYGPTKTAAEALEEDRREQFYQTWVEFFELTTARMVESFTRESTCSSWARGAKNPNRKPRKKRAKT